MVSILHLADLHLDTPFKGLSQTDEKLAKKLRDATLDALDLAVAHARGMHRRGELDAVTFGGDVFDAASPSLRARRHFSQCLQDLCGDGLRCFLIAGNHDPIDDTALWQHHLKLPDGAMLFGADWDVGTVEDEGSAACAVIGRSYGRRLNDGHPLDGFDAARRRIEAPVWAGMLHCDVGASKSEESGYAPVSLSSLEAAGCDAWLLGHIHRPRPALSTSPWIGYPGNLQGRDVNEDGPRGALLVRLETGRPAQAEFVPMGPIRWERLSVSVSGCQSDSDVVDAVGMELVRAAREAKGLIARVTLTGHLGSVALWQRLHDPEVLTDVTQNAQRPDGSPFILVESIVSEATRPLRPREELLTFGYPVGHVLRLLDEAKQDETSPAARHVLAALDAFASSPGAQGWGGWRGFAADAGMPWTVGEVLGAAEEVILGHLCAESETLVEEESLP